MLPSGSLLFPLPSDLHSMPLHACSSLTVQIQPLDGAFPQPRDASVASQDWEGCCPEALSVTTVLLPADYRWTGKKKLKMVGKVAFQYEIFDMLFGTSIASSTDNTKKYNCSFNSQPLPFLLCTMF